MSDFHSKKYKQILKELKTSEKGLSKSDVERRIKRHGYNELPKEKPLGKIQIFFSQFNNALVYILLVAFVLSLVLSEYIDASVIITAVIINVIIGFFQENKANQSIKRLKDLVEHKAIVIREGQEKLIDSTQITIGDIIKIRSGNRIPADARMMEAIDLQINESSLTGESIPATKKIEEMLKGTALPDRNNMVYAGTTVVHGLGLAVVTSIGAQTEIGKIALLVKNAKEEKTPLQLRLQRFSRLLAILFAFICIFIVIIGLIQKRDFLEMVETGVAIGVASIPEGLTIAVTFILALGMQQILKKKALTRKLVAAETLGSTTVICTDKTGTLTEGKMHVAHIVVGQKEFEVESPGSRQDSKEAKLVSLALQTAMMCNDAVVENPEDELREWKIIGSPTESALLSAAIQSGLRKEELLKKEPLIDELPFDSEKKYMISLHSKSSENYILYEKGAAEGILKKSKKYYHLGGIHSLDEKGKKSLLKTYENLTSRGLRVIGLATKEFKSKKIFEKGKINWDEIDENLTFIGFIAIKDPLRPEAKETIEICKSAGIRPIMITGDHRLTARAIASEVGLNAKAENIYTGEDLDKIDDRELEKLVTKIDIYARVSPHHKLRIVKALQARGEVVAMTGDGINDSPALKVADIGISLGTGTDVAKETSDIILLDDNFATIVSAVKQGRIIFNNIRKVITYLISDSFSEMILIAGSIIMGTPLAILPANILWLNIVNDGLPDFSLAFEKGDDKIMEEKPIKKNASILTKEMKLIIFGVGIFRDLLIFGLFYYILTFYNSSIDFKYLQTLIFVILGIKSLMGIFSLRRFKTPIWKLNPFSNKLLLLGVSASFLLMLIAIYWPPLQKILSTTSLDLNAWLIVFAVGLLNIIMIEAIKYIFIIKTKKQY